MNWKMPTITSIAAANTIPPTAQPETGFSVSGR